MLQVRTTASLANASEAYEGFPPSIEIGVELARNSVQGQEGFAQEEKVDRHWIAMQSQLLHDLERRVEPRQVPLAMARRRSRRKDRAR